MAEPAVAAGWEEVDYFDRSYTLEKKKKKSHIHIAKKKMAYPAVAAGWEEVE